jgi:DNA modification methylase
MKPYYENGAVTIYHANCIEVLPLSETVDLIVTDPPYGVSYKSNRGDHAPISGDESLNVAKDGLKLAIKCLRRGRHIYTFGSKEMLDDMPLCGIAELIWDKVIMGMGDLTSPWGKSHENIYFATYEISKANRDKGFGSMAARLRRGTVLRSQRAQSGQSKVHPTQKPIDILRQLIESSSIIGETVLDPFMGSGSTLIAAAMEGRRAIGIEIEERYCEHAAKRIAALSEILENRTACFGY